MVILNLVSASKCIDDACLSYHSECYPTLDCHASYTAKNDEMLSSCVYSLLESNDVHTWRLHLCTDDANSEQMGGGREEVENARLRVKWRGFAGDREDERERGWIQAAKIMQIHISWTAISNVHYTYSPYLCVHGFSMPYRCMIYLNIQFRHSNRLWSHFFPLSQPLSHSASVFVRVFYYILRV